VWTMPERQRHPENVAGDEDEDGGKENGQPEHRQSDHQDPLAEMIAQIDTECCGLPQPWSAAACCRWTCDDHRAMQHIGPQEFEQVVEEALEELPEQFASLLDNIVVVVEEEPTDHDLDILENDANELLGIYRGTPMTRRTHDMMLLPDQIAIFRGPILRVTRNRRDAVQQIRQTVIHELGHYFGLDDDEMVF